MTTRRKRGAKTIKMATKPTVDIDSIEIIEKGQQGDSYSFNECKQIGKNFLDELKESIRIDYLRDSGELQGPQVKATKYLAETEILQLLEDLIAKLVFKRPEKPIDFLVKEMEELKRKGAEKCKEDNTAY